MTGEEEDSSSIKAAYVIFGCEMVGLVILGSYSLVLAIKIKAKLTELVSELRNDPRFRDNERAKDWLSGSLGLMYYD